LPFLPLFARIRLRFEIFSEKADAGLKILLYLHDIWQTPVKEILFFPPSAPRMRAAQTLS
jgi:hypothetical protein